MVEKEIRSTMEEIKKMHKNSLRIFWWGWVIWFVENLIFAIIYGWHTTPANVYEKWLDYTTSTMMLVGFVFMVRSLWKMDDLMTKLVEEDE